MILGNEAVVDTALKIGTGDVPDLAALLLAITAFVQWQVGTLLEAYHRAEEFPRDVDKMQSIKWKLASCTAFELCILALLVWLFWHWVGAIVLGTDSFSVVWARCLFGTVLVGAGVYGSVLGIKFFKVTKSWWWALFPYGVLLGLVVLMWWFLSQPGE